MIELIEYEDDTLTLDNLSEKIHKLRKKKSLSLERLSKLAGVSPGAINKMERGERYPTAYVLLRTVDALGQELIMREKR